MGFTIEIGKAAPDFSLPGTDGATHSLSDFTDAAAVVVIFTCNHCPVAIASEDRLVEKQAEYADKGVAFVAINSNEDKDHPTDSFDHMVERAKEKAFNFPYLRDESQDVAKAYGAQRTPHYFLLDRDRNVVYTGRECDDPNDVGNATSHELWDAIDALLAGQPVPEPETDAIGCNVKWWGKDAHWMPESLADFA